MTRPVRQPRRAPPPPPRVVIEPALVDDPIARREADERLVDVLVEILDAAERRQVG